jgi:aryl-alcohol dehydrogenase-like predicted oxidoreductase
MVAGGGPQVPEEYLYTVIEAIEAIAKDTGKTVPQIALNWLLRRPTISSVIVGARNVEQLKQNLGATGWELTKEQVAALDEASVPPKSYPAWKQAGFQQRNPLVV